MAMFTVLNSTDLSKQNSKYYYYRSIAKNNGAENKSKFDITIVHLEKHSTITAKLHAIEFVLKT
jgi:hypothetical protein